MQRRQDPILAVYDKKTGLYDRPFTARHVNDALRDLAILKQDDQTKFGKNPEDFELFQLGTYEDETGAIQPSNPVQVS